MEASYACETRVLEQMVARIFILTSILSSTKEHLTTRRHGNHKRIPLHWPSGRIAKVQQGDDIFVRVAEVKTLKGTVRKAIARLAQLPINDIASCKDSIQKDVAEQNTSSAHINHNESTRNKTKPK